MPSQGFGGSTFGFESEGGMSGFMPATGISGAAATSSPNAWGFSGVEGGSPGEDYLDDEERERVERVIAEAEERKRKLFEKQEEEDEKRRERKAKGREELVKWNEDRQKQI